MNRAMLCAMSRPEVVGVALRYPVAPRLEDWVIPEGNVPESVPHNDAAREKERERAQRIELERRLAALEAKG